MDETKVNEIIQENGVDITPTTMEITESTPILNETDVSISMSMDDTNDGTNHALLYGRELHDQHPISAITNLESRLEDIESVKRVYSSESGVAEFRRWSDGNSEGENRTGYFITMNSDETISKCGTTDHVYGVTVSTSGFVGNQNSSDKSDDYSYAMVGIVGALRVRVDNETTTKAVVAGDYVIPNIYGEAVWSEDGYGYKVLAMGSNSSYEYAVIDMTPCSDALVRVGGSGSGSGTGSGSGDLNNIILELQGVKNDMGTVQNNIGKLQIQIDNTMSQEEIEDIINENLDEVKNQATGAANIAQQAIENAQYAQAQASAAATSAATAQQQAESAANEAFKQAQQAATDAKNLTESMQEVLNFTIEGDATISGASGLIQVTKDNASYIGEMMTTISEHEEEIGALLLKSTDGGLEIQSLINHIDKYSIGKYSTSYGLSKKNAQELLTSEYIYVPTPEYHEEILNDISIDAETGEEIDTSVTITFERGYAYKWDPQNQTWNKDVDAQGQLKVVSTATTYKDGETEGDLWYCWGDPIEIRDDQNNLLVTYHTGTLYRWSGLKWIGVATVADNEQSRMITSTTQTAYDITQSVLNGTEEGSTFKQGLDNILSTVKNNDGYISALEQTAESIRAGTYSETDKASQLEMLVSDTDASLNAVTSGRFHIMYQSYLGAEPSVYDNGHKYSKMPDWDDKNDTFVFNDDYIDDTSGIYYFYSEDKTKYCKIVDDGYEIYTLGNKATAALNSRIDETEAILSGTAEYAKENSTALAAIIAKADANSATIDNVTSYYYHTKLSISDVAIPVYGGNKYTDKPTWDILENKYVFSAADRDNADGIYYFVDAAQTTYCKVVNDANGGKLYEIYGLAGSYMASISQGADENGGYIQSMVLDIERYSVGTYSQSYGMSYDDAVKTLAKGTMYVPTVAHSENLIRDELTDMGSNTSVLNAGTLEDRENSNDVAHLNSPPISALDVTEMQTYDFDTAYRYEWDGTGWTQGAPVTASAKYFEYDGSEGTTDLWYCTDDIYHNSMMYSAGTLYAWRNGCWVAIASTHDNALSRSLSLVRQTAESYSIQLQNAQGDYSKYEQTVDKIAQAVYGADGSSGSLEVTKDGLYGEVYNPSGVSATLKGQADASRAMMDLMVSGYYHKLDLTLSTKAPDPINSEETYLVRPSWSTTQKQFVFDEEYKSENGIYYFFDTDFTHYCKVTGSGHEIYSLGDITSAGTDAITNADKSVVNTFAQLGEGHTSVLAGLRNIAMEGVARSELLASLETHKLVEIVTPDSYEVPPVRYSKRPDWDKDNGIFVFDNANIDSTGLYVPYEKDNKYYCKLVMSLLGTCLGYELYEYDSLDSSGLIATVLDNQSSVGLVTYSDNEGKKHVNGSVIVNSINDQSEVKISGDKINIEGITTFNSTDGTKTTTVIDGAYIKTGTIAASKIDLSAYSTTAEVKSLIKSEIDGFSLSVSNGTKSSTIKLTKDSVQVASATIQFSGNVLFASDLGASGTTSIDGARIETGTISADRIDVDNLKIETVWAKDGSEAGEFKMLHTTYDSNGTYNNTTVHLGHMEKDTKYGHMLKLYGTNIYMKATDGTQNTFTISPTKNPTVTAGSNWTWGTINSPIGTLYVTDVVIQGDGFVGYLSDLF